MRVLLSWSGEPSKRVAAALHNWLPMVLQAVDPWFSDKDLEKGAPWMSNLMRELRRTKVGVFCLTPGNLKAEWIQWEAASCAVKLNGRVFTYLHGVDYADVKGPLSMINHSLADREGTFRIVLALNSLLEEFGKTALSSEVLERSFTKWWPSLEKELAKIAPLGQQLPMPAPRSDRDLLEEMIEGVRAMQQEQAALREENAAIREEIAQLRSESSFFTYAASGVVGQRPALTLEGDRLRGIGGLDTIDDRLFSTRAISAKDIALSVSIGEDEAFDPTQIDLSRFQFNPLQVRVAPDEVDAQDFGSVKSLLGLKDDY